MPAPDRPPSFQMYPRDFLGDKNVEALEALPYPRGHVAAWAYMRLCLKAWEEAEPGVLPDDDVILAALSKLGKRWLEYRDLIARCFVVRDGKWTQKRMVRERTAQIERRKRLIEAGRKGGRKTSKRPKITSDASAMPEPGRSDAQAPRVGSPLASASASASASAGDSQDLHLAVPRTGLREDDSGAVPAGTAGSRATGNDPPEPRAEHGNGMTPIGGVVGDVLRSVMPRSVPDVTPRGSLTGADLNTDEGVIAERDAQRQALQRAGVPRPEEP